MERHLNLQAQREIGVVSRAKGNLYGSGKNEARIVLSTGGPPVTIDINPNYSALCKKMGLDVNRWDAMKDRESARQVPPFTTSRAEEMAKIVNFTLGKI